VRAVDLAVYADALAGEAAAVAARAERARARLRQATIEREARAGLPAPAIARLQARGLLRPLEVSGVREELRELERDLEAMLALQSWVEARLAAEIDDYEAPRCGESATRSPPSSS
jgi:hypothetical protein